MADVPAWLVSAVEGRYVPERELGRGGMAIVYLARDVRHGRQVALKLLHPERGRAIEAERFLREIETAANLVHPNILALHDSGEANGLAYYVMPYVDGESLADRIARSGALPLDESLRLTTEIASALAYAHARGVVHRDIKPGNILLVDGSHACIADFGLARALSRAADDRLTTTGFSVGSPLYMSPEQVAGNTEIDGKADVYSLGCVLFEMLTGRPPFVRSSIEEVMSRHVMEPAPSARDVRPEVPERADRLVRAMMAKRPADRPEATQIGAMLRGKVILVAGGDSVSTLVPAWLRSPRRAWPRLLAVAAAVLVVIVASLSLGRARLVEVFADAVPLDSTRYLLLPLASNNLFNESAALDQRLRQAFSEWKGITVVDPFTTEAFSSDILAASADAEQARRFARSVGAGRFVRGEIQTTGTDRRLYAALFAVDASLPLSEEAILLYDSTAQSAVPKLVERLLAEAVDAPYDANSSGGTRSVDALRAFLTGYAALQRWDLDAADSLLSEAIRFDPEYSRAHLWLAQARSWMDPEPAKWRLHAERAGRTPDGLTDREVRLAQALDTTLVGDYPAACAIYGELLRRNPQDLVATFGMAECHRNDPVLVRDVSTAGAWRFRGSIEQAVRHYERLFSLSPVAMKVFRAGGYAALRERLLTSTSALKLGIAGSGEYRIGAMDLEGDTLLLRTHSFAEVESGNATSSAAGVSRQRQSLLRAAERWVAVDSGSDAAYEALAIAQELLGDSSALRSIRRARTLASTPSYAAGLAATDVWLQIKFAPAGSPIPAAALSLADSTLAAAPAGQELRMAGLAMLLGRTEEARRWVARSDARKVATSSGIPASVALLSEELLVYAAAGGPVDSIRALEERVLNSARNSIDPAELAEAEAALLVRALTLAFPAYQSPLITRLSAEDDYLLQAQRAYLNGNIATVRTIFERIARRRASQRPSDLRLEAVYPEAWLLAQVGDAEAAAAWLQPVLEGLRWYPPGAIESIASVGAWLGARRLEEELGRSQQSR